MGLKEILGGFPVIETARLRLREVQPETDARGHYLLWSDPEVYELTPDLPAVSEEDSLLALRRVRGWFYGPRETISWAIAEKESDRYIGGIGFYEFSGHGLQVAQASIALSRADYDKGLASEAVRAVVAYGFGRLWLHRIELTVDPQDEAAVKVARGAGFTDECILRQCVYNERTSGWEDQRVLAILRPEWEPEAGNGRDES